MIEKNDILQKAEKLVYDKLHTDTSGHDWWHVVRVRNLARELAEKEGADTFICELTALLHDMADDKLNADPEQALEDLKCWLSEQKCHLIILTILFRLSQLCLLKEVERAFRQL
jgi:uncharacterized protein